MSSFFILTENERGRHSHVYTTRTDENTHTHTHTYEQCHAEQELSGGHYSKCDFKYLSYICSRREERRGESRGNDSSIPAVCLASTVRVGGFVVLRPQDASYTARGACLKSKSWWGFTMKPHSGLTVQLICPSPRVDPAKAAIPRNGRFLLIKS